MGRRKCGEDDFERWYARSVKNKECLMGHKVCTLLVEAYIYPDEHGVAMVQAPQVWLGLLRW